MAINTMKQAGRSQGSIGRLSSWAGATIDGGAGALWGRVADFT